MTHRCGVPPLCPAGAVAPGHLIEVPGCPLPGQTEPNGRWCPRSGALLPAGFAPPPGWVPWHRRVTARCRRWRHRPRAGSGRSRSSRAEGLCRGRSPLPTMAHTSGCCPRWCRWLRRRHRGPTVARPGRHYRSRRRRAARCPRRLLGERRYRSRGPASAGQTRCHRARRRPGSRRARPWVSRAGSPGSPASRRRGTVGRQAGGQEPLGAGGLVAGAVPTQQHGQIGPRPPQTLIQPTRHRNTK